MTFRVLRPQSKLFDNIFRPLHDTLPKQPWAAWNHGRSHPHFSARRGKTTTVVKAQSLPQGALPPLPVEQPDVVSEKLPRMLQQHLNNVRKFKDCVVLTEVGDFYEMYFDQVEQYAPLVNLKKAKKGDVPMAGFQRTQLARYLKMFVQDHGKQVAISQQFRLPDDEQSSKSGKPRYDRKVTRIVTAGTLIDESFLDPFENNYLVGVHFGGPLPSSLPSFEDRELYERYKRSTEVGLSWVDLSSGDFFTQKSDLTSLPSLLARLTPREVVLDSTLASFGAAQLHKVLGEGSFSIYFHEPTTGLSTVNDWEPMLDKPVPDETLAKFTAVEVAAGSFVLDYVRDKLQNANLLLQPPVQRLEEEYMAIDRQSLRNLEIRDTLRSGSAKGSLLHTIRETVTKSGARLLSQRVVSPSLSLSVINSRLDLVQEMLDHESLREETVGMLKLTSDTCRLLQKFSIGRGDADDLLGLAKTIRVTQQLSEALHDHIITNQDTDSAQNGDSTAAADYGFIWDILSRLSLVTPEKLAKSIQEAIDEEGLNQRHLAEEANEAEAEEMAEIVMEADEAGEKIPKLSHKGARPSTSDKSTSPRSEDIWIMRRHASRTLEQSHQILDSLLASKEELSAGLKIQLKSQSLTLRWSSALGHHCHFKGTDAQGRMSSLDGARTIAATKNTRSFYFHEWTRLGVQIDETKLRIRVEEDEVFRKLRGQVLENLMKLRRNAAVLDELDVACSSALVAKQRNLIRPILHNRHSHKIIGGRHPTVDVGLAEQGRSFTSNDCAVGDHEKIYLITGPNMAGKSTYLRQNALITILAQMGCFVPADFAEIGLVDKIFSRVGSADNLYQDQSTFMVEMLETADILKQATPRSFVIMDEVGRGTTPEDGVAVGYACLHHLQHVNKCRTLFATHFHALADMTRDFDDLACYCTDVAEEEDGSWSYVHKLRQGVNRDSHALKVAKLAGLPEGAIEVAADVLANLQRSCQTTADVMRSPGREQTYARRSVSAVG